MRLTTYGSATSTPHAANAATITSANGHCWRSPYQHAATKTTVGR